MKIFFLEKGHIGYQKIENFKLISKKQTCLSDKMPPQKVKINKLFSKFAKSHFFLFFNFNFFWGAFCHWGKFAILKSTERKKICYLSGKLCQLCTETCQVCWNVGSLLATVQETLPSVLKPRQQYNKLWQLCRKPCQTYNKLSNAE